jgi:sugar O-acyltransferase (sialic acid O-acetyltransferase NeuD family)
VTGTRSASPQTSLVIVGAGGFGGEVLQYVRDAIRSQPDVSVRGFLDDRTDLDPRACDGLPLLGSISSYSPQADDRFVVAIGDPEARTRVIDDLRRRGASFFRVVHPTAFVATTAQLGEGCIVAPFCAIGNAASLGDHVVLTWYASVAHDAEVASYAVLSPYSTVNGGAHLGEGAFLGTHAAVNPLQRVGCWAKVAAGSVVYRPVPAHHLAMGNPAKSRPLMQPTPTAHDTQSQRETGVDELMRTS